MSHPTEQATPAHLTGFWKRRIASLFRWLHIYLSMVSFAILFFFAVTGLTLNHPGWFFSEKVVQEHGQLDRAWIGGAEATVKKLEVVEHLRRTHGIKGAMSEFRIEDTQCAVTFKGPGYAADAYLNRATGAYDVTITRSGLVAVLNDLHKGRDTGRGWSVLIDVAAVLMVLVSVSGMVLIYFVKRRFVSGVIAALVGAAVSYAIYALLVP